MSARQKLRRWNLFLLPASSVWAVHRLGADDLQHHTATVTHPLGTDDLQYNTAVITFSPSTSDDVASSESDPSAQEAEGSQEQPLHHQATVSLSTPAPSHHQAAQDSVNKVQEWIKGDPPPASSAGDEGDQGDGDQGDGTMLSSKHEVPKLTLIFPGDPDHPGSSSAAAEEAATGDGAPDHDADGDADAHHDKHKHHHHHHGDGDGDQKAAADDLNHVTKADLDKHAKNMRGLLETIHNKEQRV